MYRIYFEKRCIIICGLDDEALTDPNAVQYHFGEKISLHALVTMFKSSHSLTKIYVPTPDVEGTYSKICAEFYQVNAGGGLVSNRRGDYLLIKRYNLWDLPKGHQEEGEPIEQTALREVTEETGIEGLQLQDLICITHHCYIRNSIWHLKHTYWYHMRHNSPTELTPQKEEDISKATWVAKSNLPSFLTNTFPSIAEVFHEAKI